jgi:hypothetical protein
MIDARRSTRHVHSNTHVHCDTPMRVNTHTWCVGTRSTPNPSVSRKGWGPWTATGFGPAPSLRVPTSRSRRNQAREPSTGQDSRTRHRHHPPRRRRRRQCLPCAGLFAKTRARSVETLINTSVIGLIRPTAECGTASSDVGLLQLQAHVGGRVKLRQSQLSGHLRGHATAAVRTKV